LLVPTEKVYSTRRRVLSLTKHRNLKSISYSAISAWPHGLLDNSICPSRYSASLITQ
jgi:hypothetical protein